MYSREKMKSNIRILITISYDDVMQWEGKILLELLAKFFSEARTAFI